MSDIVKADKLSELLANTDSHILTALRNSVYPGAKYESIALLLAYCKAKKYDPLAKAVHIVQMDVRDAKNKTTSKRDVIMPGIASYRIDAERTGRYAGLSVPEFGDMVTKKFDNKEFTYPDWCVLTAKKIMPDGSIAEFSAKEFWIENYAKKGKDYDTGKQQEYPNSMWEKRCRGQLAKCTEAQVLRKAFPDAVGNLPTFEEMEGKTIDDAEAYIKAADKIINADNKIAQIKQMIKSKNETVILQPEPINTPILEEVKEVISWQDVMKKIDNCLSLKELQEIGKEANNIEEEHKETVREHFKAKKTLLELGAK